MLNDKILARLSFLTIRLQVKMQRYKGGWMEEMLISLDFGCDIRVPRRQGFLTHDHD